MYLVVVLGSGVYRIAGCSGGFQYGVVVWSDLFQWFCFIYKINVHHIKDFTSGIKILTNVIFETVGNWNLPEKLKLIKFFWLDLIKVCQFLFCYTFCFREGYSCHINWYENVINFFLFTEEVTGFGVRFRLYGVERMRRERMIGESIIGFASLSLDAPSTHWVILEPRSNLSVSYI